MKSSWKCRLENGGHFVSASMCYKLLPVILQVVLCCLWTEKRGMVHVKSIDSHPPAWQKCAITLQCRHNERDCVSNDLPHDCLLNRLFKAQIKEIAKYRVTGLCREIHRCSVDSPHKGPVTRKMFPFDNVIMNSRSVPRSHWMVGMAVVWSANISKITE